MQTKTEFLIWDKIVNSAKHRFDYDLYSNRFKHVDPHLLDKVVLHIILGFASGECHEAISTNLHNELQFAGLDIRDEILDTIVEDKHVIFSSEIYAAYLTFSMLEDGHSEFEILGCITDLLENPHVH